MARLLILWTLALLSPAAIARIDGKTVVGFSQIGAESAWRIANSKSIKDAAQKASVILMFADAQQKQENQIKAIKTFILQKVDVIAFAPIVTSGWTEVLLEAKKAGIPVILLDRQIDAKDKDLYVSFIGADFREEGRRAGKCMTEVVTKLKLPAPIRIVELRGTEGSAPAKFRQQGFMEEIAKHPGFKVVRSENGDFKESVGKELMQAMTKKRKDKVPVSFNAIFAHNDNMALGAIAALEEVGMNPGKDIAIVSVDAIRDAFRAMEAGKLNCTVECTPLLGPQLMKAIADLMDGKTLPKHILSEEGVFSSESAAKELPLRTY